MIGGRKPLTVTVHAGAGMASSDTVVSFGLITTELVINAFKHAFIKGQSREIVVSYKSSLNGGWTLSVSDNGVGMPEKGKTEARIGLGTTIIAALSHQLDATVRTESSSVGTTVSLTHAGD